MDQETGKNEEYLQRVIGLLNRKQVDYLDKIGKDALFSAGAKLSRSKIISILVDLLMELEINGEGVSSPEELKARIKGKLFFKRVEKLLSNNNAETQNKEVIR